MTGLWGSPPEKGDKVYIDFGDGVNDGELVGVAQDANEEAVRVDGVWYRYDEVPHIEVMDDSDEQKIRRLAHTIGVSTDTLLSAYEKHEREKDDEGT